MNAVLVSALCLISSASVSSVARLPEPQDVHFSSVNLRNIVRWTPGDGSPDGTVFSVEYAIYGDAEASSSEQVRWRRVSQCSSIAQSECDLSQETFDLHEEYYARVRAVSARTQSLWSESALRFRPISDTVLGAPLVDVNVKQNYMNITIKGPFRWRTKRTKKDKSLLKIFPHMIYNVSVFNSRSNHTNHMRVTNGSLRMGPLEFSTQFCVTAHAESESLPLAYKRSEPLCTETPKDPFGDQLLAAMLGGVLPSALCLCVLAVLGGLVHCYVTDHRQTLPKSTHVTRMSENLQTFQPETPPTIIFNIFKADWCGDECSPRCPAALLQIVSAEDSSAAEAQPAPPVSYAQQLAPPPAGSGAQAEDSESEDSEPQEPLHSEAGDYGIVVQASFDAPDRCQAEVSPYRTQCQATDPRPPEDVCEDEQDDEEEAHIFLDWSPDTHQLKIPLMGLLGLEDEPQIQTEAVSLLPNVILRQASEEASEQEDDFTKMERDWGLIIHSNPE